MEILLLSTLHNNATGILKITSQEIAVYDPITGKKKSRVIGAEYMDDFIIPGGTTAERLSRVQPKGSLFYDTTDENIYIGDGETAGGRLFTTVDLEARVAALEDEVYGFENSAMSIIGEE